MHLRFLPLFRLYTVHRPSDIPKHDQSYRDQHTIRVMAGMVISLALLIAVVKWWPVPGDYNPTEMTYTTLGPETIQFEEIIQTNQQKRTPPPPAPLPPVVVPNDVIIEEQDLAFEDSFLPIEDPGTDTDLAPGLPEGPPTQLASVDTDPKPVRVSHPEYTREARRRNIRAEVVIEILIDEKGRVEESKIVERYLLGKDENDPKQPVDELGYGLEEAFYAAVERWIFRPARKNGVPVRSHHRITLSVGV